MNQPHLPIHDGDADALNAYLDGLTGFDTAPTTDVSPDLQTAVTRLYALAAAAGPLHSEEQPMNATTAADYSLESIITPSPIRRAPLRSFWTRSSRIAQIASTAAIVLLTLLASLGVFRAFDPSGGNGDRERFIGAVPLATLPDDAVTSSIPYPTAEECTATPRTREEVASILRTPPDTELSVSPEPKQAPDQATADDILATYRQFAACTQKGFYHMLSADLVTEDNVFYLVYFGPFFGSMPAAESDAEIEWTLNQMEASWSAMIPERGATPAPSPIAGDGFNFNAVPTIFLEDLTLYGSTSPNSARPRQVTATAYWVDRETKQVLFYPPRAVLFYEIDGRWVIAGEWVMEDEWGPRGPAI